MTRTQGIMRLALFGGLALVLSLAEGCQCSDSAPPAAQEASSSSMAKEAPAAPVPEPSPVSPAERETSPSRLADAPQGLPEAAAPDPMAEGEGAERSDRALDDAIRELEAGDPQRRWQALEVLEERGDAAAAKALGRFVLDAREETYAYDALDSLSAMATPESTEAIANVLEARVPSETKIYALESLMDLETPEAAAAARQAFQDDDPEVRAEAIEAMLWFDDRTAIGDLRDALSRESDPDVRDLLVDVIEFYENTTPGEN